MSALPELESLLRRIDESLYRKPGEREQYDKKRLDRTLQQLATRRTEGVRLFQPFPKAVPFLESTAKWRLVVGSNQSSKTTHAVYDFCRWATSPAAANCRAIIVALDWGDIADPLYRKMFEPGAFPVIRDLETGFTRAVRIDPADPTRVDPEDEARRDEWRDSDPLIPERMVAGINWYKPTAKQPYRVQLTNGLVIAFRSSKGRPKRGSVYDRALFDEQLENPEWFYETSRGLMARRGRAVWSATPQDCSPCLQELHSFAERGADWVQEFSLFLADNPFLSDVEKRIFEESLPDDQRDTRILGKYPISTRKVYQRNFHPEGIHGCEPFDIDPAAFARFAFADPGSTHFGTVLAAVDPDEQYVYIYDSFDIRDGTGTQWARAMKEREKGYRFEAMVIDTKAGQQRPMAMEVTVASNLWDKLLAAGVQPRSTDHVRGLGGFFAGNANVAARERCLLDWMRVRDVGPFVGTPRLQMVRGANPMLERQVIRAYYVAADKRATKGLTEDLLDCLEYGAAFNPYYRTPEAVGPGENPVLDNRLAESWKRKREGTRRRRQRIYVTVS